MIHAIDQRLRSPVFHCHLVLCLVALSLGGCLHPLPPPLTLATVKTGELPGDQTGLIRYADQQFDQQSEAAVENSVVAVDKAMGVGVGSYEALWRAARACAWLSYDQWDSKPLRAQFAYKGVEYAKAAVALEAGKVEGQYYLATNTGQWATTRTVGAYPLIARVVKAGKVAVTAQERFDHAGPLRLLGTVYVKAPAWPVSVGDTDEGLKLLARAVELAPDYPQNHLLYATALVGDKRCAEAEHEFGKVLSARPIPEWTGRLERWKREAEAGMKPCSKARPE